MSTPLPDVLSGVVFDLDGTLVDSSQDLTRALNVVLRANGCEPVDVQQVRDWVGQGARHMISRALEYRGADVDHDVYPAFRAAYMATLTQDTRTYPGITRLLAGLRRRGVPIAVCTNKPFEPAMKLIVELGLSVMLDAVVGGDSLDVKKPAPEPVALALQKIGVRPEGAVMIGDSVADMGAGDAAGLATIGVSWGYGDCSGATRVVDTVDALTELLLPESG